MAYEDFKDWTRRTDTDKILRYKAFFAKNPEFDGYPCGRVSMVYRKMSGSSIKIENI